METEKRTITEQKLQYFYSYLEKMETSERSLAKYKKSIQELASYVGTRQVTKGLMEEYKARLLKTSELSRVNMMLIPVNHFLRFLGWSDCRMALCILERNREDYIYSVRNDFDLDVRQA